MDLSWTSFIKDYFRPPSTTAFLLRPSNPTLLLGLFQHSFGTGLLYLFLKLVEGLFQMLKWEKGFVKRNLSTFNWRIYDLNLNMNQRAKGLSWNGAAMRFSNSFPRTLWLFKTDLIEEIKKKINLLMDSRFSLVLAIKEFFSFSFIVLFVSRF